MKAIIVIYILRSMMSVTYDPQHAQTHAPEIVYTSNF